MLYVKLAQDGTTIEMIHHMPFDKEYGLGKSKEELEAEGGVFVDTLPEPENIPGKGANMKFVDGEIVFEYVDRELTQEEKIEGIQLENADLMLQNAMQDMKLSSQDTQITQLQADNAELMFMLASSQTPTP